MCNRISDISPPVDSVAMSSAGIWTVYDQDTQEYF